MPLHAYIQPKTIMITKLFVYKTPGKNNEYIIYKSYLLLYFEVLLFTSNSLCTYSIPMTHEYVNKLMLH